jgi:hypothetical protein
VKKLVKLSPLLKNLLEVEVLQSSGVYIETLHFIYIIKSGHENIQ